MKFIYYLGEASIYSLFGKVMNVIDLGGRETMLRCLFRRVDGDPLLI